VRRAPGYRLKRRCACTHIEYRPVIMPHGLSVVDVDGQSGIAAHDRQ
jgi:hypothetical protein